MVTARNAGGAVLAVQHSLVGSFCSTPLTSLLHVRACTFVTDAPSVQLIQAT
jgi:hypothetical protein